MRFAFKCLVACLLVTSPLHAEDAKPNAELKARAEELISQTPGAAAVWVAQDDGNVRHIQSGMECLPGWPPRMPLTVLAAFPSTQGTGTDVACDYESLIDTGKLDVYATKTRPGETLDQAFEKYRAEIYLFHKAAVSKGAFSATQTPGLKFPDEQAAGLRTEIFTYDDKEGNPAVSYLIVSQQSGWTVEVRMTIPFRAADKDMTSRIFAFAAMHGATDSIAKSAAPQVAPQ